MSEEQSLNVTTVSEEGLETLGLDKKGVVTEVTSIAQEEAKTGQKVNIPNAEELVSRASMSFISNRKSLGTFFSKLSAKAKTRVMLSILDLPTQDLPVTLKTDVEKMCFALGQRCINDRFVITYHHMVEEQKRIKAEQEQVKSNSTVDSKEAVDKFINNLKKEGSNE